MKYLITNLFVAIRKGEFVKANEDAGEFIYDTDGVKPTRAVAIGLAEELKIKFSKSANIKTITHAVNEKLASINLPEIKEMTNSDKVEALIKDGKESDKSNDEIMIEVMQLGLGYKAAVKAFENTMRKLGFMMKPSDRTEAVKKILTDIDFKPETYEEIEKAVDYICENVAETSKAQARGAINKYAKENEIELPKKPKGQKGGAGGAKQLEKLVHWILGNADQDEKAYLKYCESENIGKGRVGVFKHVFKAVKSYDEAA